MSFRQLIFYRDLIKITSYKGKKNFILVFSKQQGFVLQDFLVVRSNGWRVLWSGQHTFLLSCLWARVLFDSGASHSFIAASVVIELGLEVEALEEPLYVSSPLRIRARLGMICRGCELEISRILLTVDLRVMDMSEFDVILGMDWLTAYRVVIDCERRRVIACTLDSTRVVFQGDKHSVLP